MPPKDYQVHSIFGVIQAGVYRGGWRLDVRIILLVVLLLVVPTECTDHTLSLQKKAIRLNNQGKTMIAKDSFVPLL